LKNVRDKGAISVIKSGLRHKIDQAFEFLPPRASIYRHFYRYHRRFPRLDAPLTFNEKIARRKLYDRDPLIPRLADKIMVKEYVAEVLGTEWLIPSLWSGANLPPRCERNWPIPYVIKANHGSAWNIFVLSPEDRDWERIEDTVEEWLRETYGQSAGEWLYSEIKPALLVEPFMGKGEVAPPDYKFWVFAGRTAFVQVDLGRLQTHRQFFYDTNWNRQSFTYLCPYDPEEIEPPKSLDRMIQAANLLGSRFPFVRIDFYEFDGRPMFGEFTFYPNSGQTEFKPESVELEMGRLWPD
jgi:hypothetical protein